MAMPSSPPLLPEGELPSSPPALPAFPSLPASLSQRKRPLSEYEDSLSSDPLFSEEPSEAEDLSRYDQPKRKRMIQGPWWKDRGKAKQRDEDDIERGHGSFRNVDSGVFMGSDRSMDSIDSILSSQKSTQRLDVNEQPYRAVASKAIRYIEPAAKQVIDEAIDAGKETFDLSGLGLAKLSPDTLEPLRHLIRLSHKDLIHPPSEDEFASLTPSIKLFLANNCLSTLPTALFQVDHLAVLSVRNNELCELPPSICQLTELKELNIAGNNISVLPWQLLDFLHCRDTHNQIAVRPNPLFEPTTIDGPSTLPKLPAAEPGVNEELGRCGDTKAYFANLRERHLAQGHLDVRSELELRLKLGRALRNQCLHEMLRSGRELPCREELLFLASSAIHYFDLDGAPSQKTNSTDERFPAVIDSAAAVPSINGSTRAPSLFELAFKSIQSQYRLDILPDDMRPELRIPLEKAVQASQSGNQACTSCGRSFAIPRAMWVEYWFNGLPSQHELTQETVLPFLRKACSWHCARPSEAGDYRC